MDVKQRCRQVTRCCFRICTRNRIENRASFTLRRPPVRVYHSRVETALPQHRSGRRSCFSGLSSACSRIDWGPRLSSPAFKSSATVRQQHIACAGVGTRVLNADATSCAKMRQTAYSNVVKDGDLRFRLPVLLLLLVYARSLVVRQKCRSRISYLGHFREMEIK